MSTEDANEILTGDRHSETVSTKLDKKTVLIILGTVAGFVLLIVLNMK